MVKAVVRVADGQRCDGLLECFLGNIRDVGEHVLGAPYVHRIGEGIDVDRLPVGVEVDAIRSLSERHGLDGAHHVVHGERGILIDGREFIVVIKVVELVSERVIPGTILILVGEVGVPVPFECRVLGGKVAQAGV